MREKLRVGGGSYSYVAVWQPCLESGGMELRIIPRVTVQWSSLDKGNQSRAVSPYLAGGGIHTCFAEVRQMLVRRVRNGECVWRRKLKAAVLDRIAVTIHSASAHGTLKPTTLPRSQTVYWLASDGCLFSLKRFPGCPEVFSRYWFMARGREQSIFGSHPVEHI